MKLFENQVINITKIITVNKFMTEEVFKGKSSITFPPNLLYYELIFTVCGDGKARFGETVIYDRENSVRFMPKGSSSKIYRVNNYKNGYCFDIYFDTDSPMPADAIGISDMPALKEHFIKLYNIWSEKKIGYYAESMQIFYQIISLIQKQNLKSYDYISRKNNYALDKAYDFIINNFTNHDFDYNELCRQTGFSYSYFKAMFKSRYKMSPARFVTQKRLEYANELLLTNRYSITEIAEKCGFENIYYFSNVYKKYFGVSPKNYLTAKL